MGGHHRSHTVKTEVSDKVGFAEREGFSSYGGFHEPEVVAVELDLQVATSEDDAYELGDGGFSYTTNTIHTLSHTDPTHNFYRCAGMRFQSVAIPKGATISRAYIEAFVSSLYMSDDPNLKIYGNAVDDANDFNTEADVIGRARTTAFTSWVQNGIGHSDWKQSPDISSVIQEIVDRASWASGNSIVLLLIANTDVAQTYGLQVDAWNYSDHSHAPKLHIEYE